MRNNATFCRVGLKSLFFQNPRGGPGLFEFFKPQQMVQCQFKSIVGARLIGFMSYASQANDRTGGVGTSRHTAQLLSSVPSYGTHPPRASLHYGTPLVNRPVITGLRPLECPVFFPNTGLTVPSEQPWLAMSLCF